MDFEAHKTFDSKDLVHCAHDGYKINVLNRLNFFCFVFFYTVLPSISAIVGYLINDKILVIKGSSVIMFFIVAAHFK